MRVVVMGVPRSGTSWLCMLLSERGLPFERRPDFPPTEADPSGGWEDRVVGDEIIGMLSSGRYGNTNPPPVGWSPHAAGSALPEAVKVPLMLFVWKAYFDGSCDTRFVFIERDDGDTWKSFSRYFGCGDRGVLERWLALRDAALAGLGELGYRCDVWRFGDVEAVDGLVGVDT